MESILINPKGKAELELLTLLLQKMKVSSKVISKEDQEDLGLIILMKEADRTQKVFNDVIMDILFN